MRRTKPLILAMTALRRQEEEMERRPGINPGRGRGVNARFRNWERVLGRENASMFLGKSRPFQAPPQVNIRKQPHTQPCCLTLGFRSQDQPVALTPHVPNAIPQCCPNPFLPCPCQNHLLCHQLPPPPPPQNDKKSTSSESSDSDESLSPLKSSNITFFLLFILFYLIISFSFLLPDSPFNK